MIITFSGIDGSGKTTCAEFALSYFKAKGLPAEYFHIMRDSFYYKILHDFVGKVSDNTRRSLEGALRNKKPGIAGSISRWMKKTALLANLAMFNLRFGKYKKSMSRCVIMDRYFYDDVVQGIYLGFAGKYFISVFKEYIIMPDLIFYLRYDPSEAFARKQEYDIDYFMQKSVVYDEVYRTIPHIEIGEVSISSIKDAVSSGLEKIIKSND